MENAEKKKLPDSPVISPGNTLTCHNPTVIVPAPLSGRMKEPNWMTCPACAYEVSYLLSVGVCWSCVEIREQEIAKKEKEKLAIIKVLGSEKAYDDFTFEKFQVTDGTLEAFGLCENFSPDTDNLYLFGSCGVGKSHLANAICRTILKSSADVEIVNPPALLRKLRGSKDGAAEESEINRLSTVRCLIVDDLGVGKVTEYANTVIYEIIGKREMSYRNGLVITSDLSLEEFAKKSGDDRIASRIGGLCKVVKLTGDDWRLKKGE